MKSRLTSEELAAIRHDLRTPLNHIIGYAEMLIESAAGTPQQECMPCLRRIYETGKRLVPILNVALSQNEGEPAELDLEALRRQIWTPLAQIRSDCDNLLEHAILDAARDLDRIHSATEALLAFVAQAGEGTIERAPAGLVSLQPAGHEAEDGTPREDHEAGADAARLLVVDDNETNRDMLSRRLARQGYRVSAATNGREALQMLRSGGFDLVLLDIMMPEVDGIQVLGEMKSDRALRDIPVIMISALDEIQSAVRCIEMGAEDYLSKPFDPVLLRARIGASLDKKRLRDQLMVQEKLASLGALTAGIAHEIKNPLNFVTNFAELCADLVNELRKELDAARAGETEEILANLERNLAKIQEHGKRADSIIRGMLMHSRSREGDRQAIDINALLAESVNLAFHGLRAQDPSFTGSIEAEYDPAAGTVNAVPQELSRVFLNIANNGFYAAGQKRRSAGQGFMPTLSVRTKNLGARVELRIRDNGSGIPRAVRDKIFTPFFTTKPAGAGTGLGLSISYDIIVRGHQGEIRVESKEGEFTEFTITLPRSEQKRAPGPSPAGDRSQ